MHGREVFLLQESNGVAEAGMAGVVFGRGVLRRFQSMPDGLYGGPYFKPNLAPENKAEFLKHFYDWMKGGRLIRVDIHNPGENIELPGLRPFITECHVVDLTDDAFDPGKKVVKHIRAGKRRESTIEKMQKVEHLAEFYELAVISEKRHGQKPRYRRGFFERLLELSRQDERILWLNLRAGEKLAGSRICFIEGNQILSWQFYMNHDYKELKPSHLLLDYVIDYARRCGMAELNLGWSPPEAVSLMDFKESWGGRRRAITNYRYFSRLGKLVYRWRRR